MAYEVPKWVDYMHNMRRFDVSDGGKETTNVFDPSVSTSNTYLRGIVSVGAVYWAVGALFTIVLIISALSACCCRNKVQKFQKLTGCKKFFAYLFSARLWWVICTLIIVALTAAALSQISKFKIAASGTLDDITGLVDTMKNASLIASNDLIPSLSSAASSAEAMSTTVSGSDSNAAAALTELAGHFSSGASVVTSFSSAVNGTTGKIDTSFIDTSSTTSFNSSYKGVHVGGAVVLALFFSYIIFNLVTVMSKKCCATSFRACHFLFVFSILSVFIFSGVFLVISLVAADVCYAPTDSIISALNVATLSNDAKNTVTYYMTCPAIPIGAAAYISSSRTDIEDAQTELTNFYNAYNAEAWYPSVSADYDALVSSVDASKVSLESIEEVIACNRVNTIYNSLLNHICRDGTYGVTAVWGLATAVATLFFFMGISAARMCWRHPGDPVEKAPENKDNAPQATIEMAGGAAYVPTSYAPATVGNGTYV